MIATIKLPQDKTIQIKYSDKVYSPKHTAVDTIVMVDMLAPEYSSVIDVGTGSGVLGLSVKYLRPDLRVTLADNFDDSLDEAKDNAKRLKLDVKFAKTDLLDGFKSNEFKVVVANLPTFDKEDMDQWDLYGPDSSYFADKDNGLKLYDKLMEQARGILPYKGLLICECQSKLMEEFEKLAEKHNFDVLAKTDYAFALTKRPSNHIIML